MKSIKKMKGVIKMMKSSDELKKKGNKIKTTKFCVKIMKIHRIQKINFF